ncbi:galactose-3-O-sulfotransferase 2-like [Lineus longissimus]|uniref:galactose-3-O-sulfotransferase 2-like n=1 Tax=Lineus longissimus TaxID=88925 RepID=UPI002B4C6841
MAVLKRLKSTSKYLGFLGCVLFGLRMSRIHLSVAPSAGQQITMGQLSRQRSRAAQSTPRDTNHYDIENCRGRVKNIYFLKTHKCASTTVATLLTRYAVQHSLTLALPSAGLKDKYHIGWPAPLNPRHVFKYKDGRKINIIALHTTYNRSAVNEIMPRHTLKIGIIRDPLTQFWSAFDFFHLGNLPNSKANVTILTYLQDPMKYARPLLRFHGNRYFKNFLLTEFGYPDHDVTDIETIRRFASDIFKQFDLIMTYENLYESVVLMRRLLCWDFKSILMTHFHKNKNFQQHLAGNEKLRELHKSWSSADYIFYEYLQSKFLDSIKEQDDDFVDEVEHLKNVVKNLELFCHKEERQKLGLKKYIVPKSKWNKKIVIRPADCHLYHIKIYDYHNMLIETYVEKY